MFKDVLSVANTYWTQFLYVLPRLVAAAVLMAAVWVSWSRLRTWLAAKISPHAGDPLLVDFLTQIGHWLLVGVGVILALNPGGRCDSGRGRRKPGYFPAS